MNKLAFLALPLFLLATLSAGVEPQQESATVAQYVPVGGVLLWWGTTSEIPPGFEVCDGTVPFTKNATLKERKPDLRDRFAKCAKDVTGYRPRNALEGGASETATRRTLPHVLTANEIPGHAHPIAHVHDVAAHAHSLPNHTHTLSDHIHLIGDWVAAALSGGGSQVLVQSAAGPSAQTEPGGSGKTAQGGAGNTGTGGAGQTLAASPAVSGFNTTQNTGHIHELPPSDNRPPFLEMLYIIRVL